MTTWDLRLHGGDAGMPESLRRYVLTTWQRSARSYRLPHDPAVAHRLLCSSVARLLVAEDPDEPGTAIGWLLHTPTRPPIVHYTYVRASRRRQGCARALLTAAGQLTDKLHTTAAKIPRTLRDLIPTVVVEQAHDSFL